MGIAGLFGSAVISWWSWSSWLGFSNLDYGGKEVNLISIIGLLMMVLAWLVSYYMSRPRAVYLIEFSCCLPDDMLRIPCANLVEHSVLCGLFDEKSITFQRKMLQRSGLGDNTYLPRCLHYVPPRPTLANARIELQEVLSSLDSLFATTRVPASLVSILVVNCSLFNPIPSLTSVIVNKYKLPPNVQSFNLSGMGCSAGLIAIDLASQLLRVKKDSYAVVVSTENITQNCYWGNERSMLLPNCLFRTGGAAILLSNRRKDSTVAKYKLAHLVRTHKGADTAAYRCVYQEEDGSTARSTGVALSKDLIAIAGHALKTNITTLGPLVLPLSEQLRFLLNIAAQLLAKARNKQKSVKTYIPDFTRAFEHLCIHAGGRAVIDELEKHLRLLPRHVEASRMTLHRFGNTSSSSIWYELAYLEAKGVVRKGQRVWQIGFGSGFKCNSAVWVALKTPPMNHKDSTNPWFHSIQDYPVAIPDLISL